MERASDGRKFALIAANENVYKSDITDIDNEYQDTYIVVHNKKAKEIKLMQIEQASFKHVLYDNETSNFEKNVLDTQKILAKEFAGKKGATSYERNQRTKVNSSILEDTVDKVVDAIDTEKLFENDILEQSQGERDNFRDYIFPKIIGNTDGKSVREIFTIESLLGDDIIAHLSEMAIDILNIEPSKMPFTNKYLKNIAILIQNSKQPDSEDNLKKMSMLIYAESLISLINNRQKFVNQSEMLKFSQQLNDNIIKKFFLSDSKQASSFTRQKSIVFFVILTLLSSHSLEVNLNEMLENVDLSKKELLKYASVIGCKTKGDILFIQKVSNLDKYSNFQVPLMRSKKDRKK